jgi:hypothetical protein
MVFEFPTEGHSTPIYVFRERMVEMSRGHTTTNLKEVVISNAHDLLPPVRSGQHGCSTEVLMRTHRLTMMAPSSIMQLAPITIGPAMANIVALGCTTVPERENYVLVIGGRHEERWGTPEPTVMSPLSSTS